jgi:Uma2 family endonuclease
MALTEQLTLDDFLRLPEEKPALEYARGVITQKMAPPGWHGILQGDLYYRFRTHGAPQRRLKSMPETRVTWMSEGKSYVPDAIAYRRERAPREPNGAFANHVIVPPDIAVEIWSPGHVLGDQIERCRWYIAHDVRVSLLVHPERRWVWTFRPGVESGPLAGTDAIDLNDVSEGLSFTVDELFEEVEDQEL